MSASRACALKCWPTRPSPVPPPIGPRRPPPPAPAVQPVPSPSKHAAWRPAICKPTAAKNSRCPVVTAPARPVGPGFSPLDEELELLPGSLTPHLLELLVRLGTWVPFTPAAALLTAFTAVACSGATARRQT